MINKDTLARDLAYVLAFRPEVNAFALFARRDGREARIFSPTRIVHSTSLPEEMATSIAQAADTYAKLAFVGVHKNAVIAAAFFKFVIRLYDLGEVVSEVPIVVLCARPKIAIVRTKPTPKTTPKSDKLEA